MIYLAGFESFTFRKLAKEIQSTEASVYRYFKNKHMLLLYLVNWYWEWVGALIEINTLNIKDPKDKLGIIIQSFVSASNQNPVISYVDESKLHNIVIAEGTKSYHTIQVDKDNSKGLFKSYKNLVGMVSSVIKEVNPSFEYPNALASNLFEMANNHLFFSEHLPKLTNIKQKKNNEQEVERMLNYFVDKLLSCSV